MEDRSSLPARDRSALTLAEQADAILREEIASGALANIATASQMWAARRRDLVLPETTRRLAAGMGGLLDTVLDLLAPLPRSAAAASPSPGPGQNGVPDPAQTTAESLSVLRARRPVPRGGTGEIRTGLRNDGRAPVDVGFLWSDLVAESGGRIESGCLRLLPSHVQVPPGTLADLSIRLAVPGDARPGLYHTLLQATGGHGSRALVVFPIGLEVVPEASVAM